MAADCGNGQIWDCFTGNIFGGSFKGNTDEVYICAAVAAMCCVSLHFMDCMADVDGYLKDTVVELVDYLKTVAPCAVKREK